MRKLIAFLLLAALSANFALADDAHHKGEAQSDGVIRKLDKDAQKITIRHGPLKNLDMPPMTMVFRVKDAAMLDAVKRGDKVKFNAENINGAITITNIEKSQ